MPVALEAIRGVYYIQRAIERRASGGDGTVYLLEVNGIPGWRGLQEATSVDVAAAIVEHVFGRLARP